MATRQGGEQIGMASKVDFDQLVRMMVDADMAGERARRSMKMGRVVTGDRGFVGRYVRALRARGHHELVFASRDEVDLATPTRSTYSSANGAAVRFLAAAR